jgi:hypothetical protein
MLEFFRDGGFGMYPILGFGVVTLFTAAYFAIRAQPQVKGFIEGMAKALLFSSLTGTATGFAATLSCASSRKCTDEEPLRIVMMGIRESLNCVIMGFAFLTMIYLLTAVGQRRVDAKALP